MLQNWVSARGNACLFRFGSRPFASDIVCTSVYQFITYFLFLYVTIYLYVKVCICFSMYACMKNSVSRPALFLLGFQKDSAFSPCDVSLLQVSEIVNAIIPRDLTTMH